MKTTILASRGMLFTRITSLLFNKYILAFTVFGVWVAFFDKSSLITQWRLQQTIYELEQEKEFLLADLEATKLLQQDLTKNQEKYAREKYFMKKPGEQVYIID